MSIEIKFDQPYPSARSPVMGRNMVVTSQPIAAQAGIEMLRLGGNAVDAAIATAMALTVVEPTGNGIGSDAFAIVWDGKKLQGLNASGRSPAGWSLERFGHLSSMPETGWDSVTVPGAVSGWVAMSERYGRLPFDVLAKPAIRHAREGFMVSPIVAKLWALGAKKLSGQAGFDECFLRDGQTPKAGEMVRFESHANSLEMIAETKGSAFYSGELAQAMIRHSTSNGGIMSVEDLIRHRADWVDTIAVPFAGGTVHEIPPNGQGIAALLGLGILEQAGIGDCPVDSAETLHLVLEAMKLGLADLHHHVTDPVNMQVLSSELLNERYLRQRAGLISKVAGNPGHGTPKPGGTVYLAAADSSGMMVSFIQSNYMGFGSGVVVPSTGISLQNRGAGFLLNPAHVNVVASEKRPMHTIIPGFAMSGDQTPLMAFGVMGGPIQAQGHMQMMLRIMQYGQNPQAAVNALRWRVESGRKVALEAGFDESILRALQERGHSAFIEEPSGVFGFGGAQIILRLGDGYIGGSDPRKDGQVVAF